MRHLNCSRSTLTALMKCRVPLGRCLAWSLQGRIAAAPAGPRQANLGLASEVESGLRVGRRSVAREACLGRWDLQVRASCVISVATTRSGHHAPTVEDIAGADSGVHHGDHLRCLCVSAIWPDGLGQDLPAPGGSAAAPSAHDPLRRLA